MLNTKNKSIFLNYIIKLSKKTYMHLCIYVFMYLLLGIYYWVFITGYLLLGIYL